MFHSEEEEPTYCWPVADQQGSRTAAGNATKGRRKPHEEKGGKGKESRIQLKTKRASGIAGRRGIIKDEKPATITGQEGRKRKRMVRP